MARSSFFSQAPASTMDGMALSIVVPGKKAAPKRKKKNGYEDQWENYEGPCKPSNTRKKDPEKADPWHDMTTATLSFDWQCFHLAERF